MISSKRAYYFKSMIFSNIPLVGVLLVEARPLCCGVEMVAMLECQEPINSEYVCMKCGGKVELWSWEFRGEMKALRSVKPVKR